MSTPPPDDGPPPGYGPTPGYGQQPPPSGEPEVVWAVLAHLSLFVLAGVAPLALYLVFKDSQPFTRQHAAEALNFHLTLLLASIVSGVLVVVLVGFVLLLALALFALVASLLAAVAAANRRPYRYPLTIHFVR